MSQTALKTGDIVCLKSGGPKMTVQSTNSGAFGGQVSCTWFDGKNLKTGVFEAGSLEFAKPGDES